MIFPPPVISEGKVIHDDDAPLHLWTQGGAFDSAAACERERTRVMNWASQNIKEEPTNSIRERSFWAAGLSRCVTSEDRRPLARGSVGWYLIAPPVIERDGNPATASAAPLSTWRRISSHDSAKQCDDGLRTLRLKTAEHIVEEFKRRQGQEAEDFKIHTASPLATCTLSERSFFARAPLGCDVSRGRERDVREESASVCLGGAGRQCIEAVLPLATDEVRVDVRAPSRSAVFRNGQHVSAVERKSLYKTQPACIQVRETV